jgi:nitrogen fixation NifU-like protein
MDNALRELYQEVILDHSRHPRHHGVLDSATHKAEGYNPLCGDRVIFYSAVGSRGPRADIRFQGKGCAISQASASMMTGLAQGPQPRPSAEKLMTGFPHLVKGEDATGLSEDDRETLDVMSGSARSPCG